MRMMQRLSYSISVEIAWSVWYTKINPYMRFSQKGVSNSISVEIAWSVWYTKINPYMRFSQKGVSKCLKSAKIARAVF